MIRIDSHLGSEAFQPRVRSGVGSTDTAPTARSAGDSAEIGVQGGRDSALAALQRIASRADQLGWGEAVSDAEFRALSDSLKDVERTLADAAGRSAASSDDIAASQRRIDSTFGTIDAIASAERYHDVRPQGDEQLVGGFTTGSAVNPVVGDQVAGLFLSTGGSLDLAVFTETFEFEIGGVNGSRTLSFASGTALQDVAAAINTFTDLTGVIATASGTGVRLESVGVGADEFVIVKIRDDGGIGTADNIGIYELSETDPSSANADMHYDFDHISSANGVFDLGRDAKAPLGGDADAAARDVRELLLAELGRASSLPSRTQSEHALQLLG